jgi:hypothetical protein
MKVVSKFPPVIKIVLVTWAWIDAQKASDSDAINNILFMSIYFYSEDSSYFKTMLLPFPDILRSSFNINGIGRSGKGTVVSNLVLDSTTL